MNNKWGESGVLGEEYGIIGMFIILTVHIMYSVIRGKSIRRSILISVFIIYISIVILITFFPIVYSQDEYASFGNIRNSVQFVPFRTIKNMLRYAPKMMAFKQVGGNIIMTVPFGILLPILLKRKKVPLLILYAVAFPVCIESFQFFLGAVLGTYYRMTDVDDVILNFTGIIIGYAIYYIFSVMYNKIMKK